VRQVAILLVLAFIVTMGVVIGTRMSSDAIAVLVGVVAGVAASIPCALLLMAVTRRRELEVAGRREDGSFERYEEQRRGMPPVIVVTPGNAAPQPLPYGGGYPYQLPQPQEQRQFRVMGIEEEEPQPVEGRAETAPWYR
jgi:hypothetical protein